MEQIIAWTKWFYAKTVQFLDSVQDACQTNLDQGYLKDNLKWYGIIIALSERDLKLLNKSAENINISHHQFWGEHGKNIPMQVCGEIKPKR